MSADRPVTGLVVISLMTEKKQKNIQDRERRRRRRGPKRKGEEGRGEMTTKEWEGDWTMV